MKKIIFSKLRMLFTGIVAGMFALVWWGVLYPELCFPRDTYEVVYGMEEEEAQASEEEICRRLLQADGEQVIVKSRLLEWLKQCKKE